MEVVPILPLSITEDTAAHLFGKTSCQGHEVLYSAANGLLLPEVLVRIFEKGRMVIIPDPTDGDEFTCVILCCKLLDDDWKCPPLDAPYRSIHGRRLEFHTPARPGKGYLYVHALLTLFFRRRDSAPGCENDRQQVFGGQTWASPGKWARKSMVEALALEIGIGWDHIEEDVAGTLGEFSDRKSPEEERRMAMVFRYLVNRCSVCLEDE